jgi:S-adenosylmethionine decarboxylase
MALLFEGPEKKLEIILKQPNPENRSNIDFRWTGVVKACGAEIISRKSSAELDAYLLSESSLFLWDDRILMITCGKTSLVRAVPGIIDIVGRENIAFFFYERKNLMYPHLQRSDFETDVQDLSTHFEGKSYRLGPANHDHVHIFYSSTPERVIEDDVTLEILMHDMHPAVLGAFVPKENDGVEDLEKRTGINDFYPEMEKDSYQFQPYGYSLNKIYKRKYMTIHVTPEPSGSYASFETNVFEADYTETINRVIGIFNPNRFSLVMTGSQDETQVPQDQRLPSRMTGYQPTEKSFYEFDCGYAVSFFNYAKTS